MSEQKTFLPALQSPLFADVMRMPSDNDALYSVTREQALLTAKSAVETDKQLWVYAKAGVTKKERAQSKENLEVALSHLISNLQESLNPKNKMSPKQIGEAAIFFAVEFQDLTFKEIVFAFREFKLGRYIEKLYGDLNVRIISDALRAYKISDERMELFEGKARFFREAPTEKVDPALVKEKVNEILKGITKYPAPRTATQTGELIPFEEVQGLLGNTKKNKGQPHPVFSSEKDFAPFRKAIKELKPEWVVNLAIFADSQGKFLLRELSQEIERIGIKSVSSDTQGMLHFKFMDKQYSFDPTIGVMDLDAERGIINSPHKWKE